MKKQLVILLILAFVFSPLSAGFTINSAVAQTKSDFEIRSNASRTLPAKTQFGQTEIEKEKLDQLQKMKVDKGLETKSIPQSLEHLNYVPGEVLVKFKSKNIDLRQSLGRQRANQFAVNKNLEKKEDIRKSNVSVLKTKSDESVESVIARLKNDPNVEYVEPNYIRQWTSTTPNDTDFSKLWGLHNTTKDADINAPEAWDVFTGSNSVVVAVLDSGIAYNHPDLKNNMWDGNTNHGWDFFNNDDNPIDDNGHGTHVAGTIGAEGNNNVGVTGINWDVKLMALKVGDYAGNVGDIVEAIDFAINNNVKIINASFGSPEDSQAEFDAIDRFRQAGGIFIAAAGNGGADQIGDNNENSHQYPSDYDLDNIISVAATDQDDTLVDFSNYGVISVDVGAPGVNIYSTIINESNVFSEDFEEVIPPSIGNKFTQFGSNTWGTSYNSDNTNTFIHSDYHNKGSYANNIISALDSQIINLSNKSNSYLQFNYYCDTEYIYDTLGLFLYNGSSWDLVDTFTGLSYGSKTYPLSNYAINNFQLEFFWMTDALNVGGPYFGCSVDDLKITSYSDGSDEQYGYMQGTSMAAPHVAGLAALIWGYKPELSYFEVKNTILTTGNDLASLNGKTVTGKRINARNALNSISEKKPPYAVAIDNHKDARPVSGVNEADVIYEFPVEGSITRFMAIYNPDSGINLSTEIGPVRSARPYFARTASEHNAIYAHAGGSDAALQGLINNEYNVYNIDALTSDGETYFWRDNNRLAPHNLYTSIEQLNNYRDNIYLTGGSFNSPWIFSDSPSSLSGVGFSQETVIVNYENVNYNVKWVYSENDKRYYRQSYENGSYVDYLDKNNNQVFTTNLAIQYATTDSMTELIASEGGALLCREGNCIDGKWKKNSTDDNVKFYINNGNDEFDFKTGKLWIHVTNYTATLPDSAHTISGTIKYYDGVKVIPNATVILENSIGIQIASTTTDVNGAYQFAGVTSGGDYVVRVIKSDNALGLTSADQIKIGRHIVGLESFSTIYKTIAADVNNSLGLTSADQIKIGRFIVGLDSNLPSGAWKFYSSNAVLTTANYLTVGLTRTFTNLIADMPSQDFVGIKMGDVNNSWVNN